jgi:hypothetical protein
VSSNVLALVLANALMLVLGAGLLPFLGLADTRGELVRRLPLAYAVGLAAAGILAAELALVGIGVGRVALSVLAAVALVLGLRRARPGPVGPIRFSVGTLPAVALLAVAGLYLASAARLLAVKPLLENDGWALWGMRARALYELGGPVEPVFTAAHYPALQYPLLLPELEAIAFRFMGEFDGTVVHLQLLGLAVAFVGGAWVLLRPGASPLLLAATLLAIVTAPSFFAQLPTNSADVPLGILIALGVAALAAWLQSGARGLLPAATLFLAAGAMTKNEGELFAAAAFVSALAVAPSGQRRPLLVAAAIALALIVPWHVWLLAHGVTATTFSLSNLLDPGYLVDHAYRLESAARQLAEMIFLWSSWSYVPLLVLSGIAAALVLRRRRVAAFAVSWLLLSFAGLLAVYWGSELPLEPNLYNSSNRTIVAIVIGGALLVPVLLGPGPEGGWWRAVRGEARE